MLSPNTTKRQARPCTIILGVWEGKIITIMPIFIAEALIDTSANISSVRRLFWYSWYLILSGNFTEVMVMVNKEVGICSIRSMAPTKCLQDLDFLSNEMRLCSSASGKSWSKLKKTFYVFLVGCRGYIWLCSS